MSKLSRGLIIVIIFLLLILHDPFSNSIVSQNYQLYCLAVVSIFESSFFNSPESWFSKSKLILVIPPAYSKFTTADFLNLGEILLIESLKCLEEKVKVFVFSFLSFQTEILLTKHCEDRLWPNSDCCTPSLPQHRGQSPPPWQPRLPTAPTWTSPSSSPTWRSGAGSPWGPRTSGSSTGPARRPAGALNIYL